jgi:hypothetical protein
VKISLLHIAEYWKRKRIKLKRNGNHKKIKRKKNLPLSVSVLWPGTRGTLSYEP